MNRRLQHLALDLGALTGLQRPYWRYQGSVLVTQRQMEQQVALAIQAQLVQLFRDLGSNPFQVSEPLCRPVFHCD